MGYLFLFVIIAGAICGYIYYKKVDEPKMNMGKRKKYEDQVIIDLFGANKETNEDRKDFNQGE